MVQRNNCNIVKKKKEARRGEERRISRAEFRALHQKTHSQLSPKKEKKRPTIHIQKEMYMQRTVGIITFGTMDHSEDRSRASPDLPTVQQC